MSSKLTNFKLGLFILLGTALFAALMVMVGAGVFAKKGLMVETYIDGSVQGLDIGSPLKYRGVAIGSVTDIQLVGNYYPSVKGKAWRYVMIRMELDPKKHKGTKVNVEERLHSQVKEGMRIRLASQGITGISYMEVDFLKHEDDHELEISWTPKTPYIPATRSQMARVADSIEAISRDLEAANIPQIAANVERLLTTMEQAVSEADIKGVSQQIRASLERIEAVATRIDGLAANPKLAELPANSATLMENVDQTLAELRTNVTNVSAEMNTTLGEVQGAVGDVRAHLNQPEITTAIDRFEDITRNLETILARLEGSFAQKDGQVELILAEMTAATTNMRQFSELIARYPSLAAFGTPPNPSEVYKND